MKYNLLELQKFYLENLLNRSFVFYTSIGTIVIKFNESNFCHLLGLHHFNQEYKGITGWKNIELKKITHSILKNIDKKKYETIFKKRADALYKILEIFKKSKTIKIFKDCHDTLFQCDFLLYQHDKRTYYVITVFVDSRTKKYCAGGSLLVYNDSNLSCAKYLAPSENDIDINDYYIDFENKAKNNFTLNN